MAAHFASYPSLDRKSIFITGGASGIGESIVEHFAGQGCRVKFVDIDESSGNALASRLVAQGHDVRFAACDLRNIVDLRQETETFAAQCDGIDVLINNAGNDGRHDVEDVDPAYWHDRLRVNLDHQFFAAQAVRAGMARKGGGAIVNFGSVMVQMGAAHAVAYVTAKGGIEAMTRALAREFGPDRIRVNCIVPGWIMTKRQIELYLDTDGERHIVERQCIPDKLTPDDVARMALFLAADDSRHITSQNFIVDGGWV